MYIKRAILKLVMCECIYLRHLWPNTQHSENIPQNPEKCLSYSYIATFRFGISVYRAEVDKTLKPKLGLKL